MSYSEDMKELLDMVKSMDETIDMMYDMDREEFKDKYGFSIKIAAELEQFSKDQINNFSDHILLNLYRTYADPTSDVVYPEVFDERVSLLRENMLKMHDSSVELMKLFKDKEEIMNDVNSARTDYAEYIASDEYKQKEAARKEEMLKRIETEAEGREKNKMIEWITTMDQSDNLEFIFNRFEKLKDSEIKNIVNNFFDAKKSNYIMERFNAKATKLGFNKDIYHSLLSIEENFLGEDYYNFNNLFLFISVRFIAYANIDDRSEELFARSLLLKLIKLTAHKFNTKEEEDQVIDVVRRVDSYFEEYRSVFAEKNQTDPRSDYRKSLNQKSVETTINNIKSWYEESEMIYPEELEEDLEALKAKMKEDQETYALFNWLKMYEVELPEEYTLESLKEIKENFLHPVTEEEVVEEEVTEDESEETSDASIEEESEEKPTDVIDMVLEQINTVPPVDLDDIGVQGTYVTNTSTTDNLIIMGTPYITTDIKKTTTSGCSVSEPYEEDGEPVVVTIDEDGNILDGYELVSVDEDGNEEIIGNLEDFME